MKRTNVYLEDEQRESLKHIGKENKRSMGEEIRRAVDAHIFNSYSTKPKTKKSK